MPERETETNKLSKIKKRKKKVTRKLSFAADETSRIKRANTDRSAFVREAEHSDLLPEEVAINNVYFSDDDDTASDFETQPPDSLHHAKSNVWKFGDVKNYLGIDDFTFLYKIDPQKTKVRSKCIIMSGNPRKVFWDLFVLVLLLLVCIIVPYRLAFYPEQSSGWVYFYLIMDFCFLLDIIVTFFTSVPDDATCTEITDRKEIAKLYLKGWFWIDSISIFPFDLIASAS